MTDPQQPAASEPTPTGNPAVPEASIPEQAGSRTDLSGRELTLQTPAPAGLSGRELTMQTPSGGTDLSGRELTLQTPATGISGRELTMQTPSGGTDLSGRELTLQTPATGISGRELTMQTPSGGTDLSGRELTLQTPATGISGRELTMQTPSGGTDLSGRELTIQGPATPTPVTMGAKPKTDHGFKPRTGGGGTSMSFDDAWHLQGRKGPFTGQSWGDFELGGILGEGGMGAVYRAKQKSLKRRVAIKVLPPNLAADSRLLQRFQLEATTTSKLQTPHVVQVYSIGEHEGNHFYAMEYVEGKDLYDILKERTEAGKPLTPDEACGYILQAAKGLAEAGRNQVVHRDIKPPNMMVTKDGLLKIADFGIVKVLGEHNLTMTGQAVGTPAYVSPEQGRGDREVDCRSDLYSLGVVFYEIACGQKPFLGTTPNALIYQHCYDEPKLPKEHNPAISDEIQAVILRCLQKKPENRYQTADDLVRDLEAIRTGSMLKSAIANYKLGTGADEAKREQMNWFQRNMLPLAAAAVLVVGGGGGLGYWYLGKKAEERQKAETARLEAKQRDDLARLEREQEGQRKISRLRETLGKSLDNIAPLPEDVEKQLAELASFAPKGKDDPDVAKWTKKVAEVRALSEKLKPLDGGRIDLAQRVAGKSDLASYIGKVGGGDVAAKRWTQRLDALDAEEQRVRGLCAPLDTAALTKAASARYAAQLGQLADLVPADDAQLVKWRKKLSTFDAELAQLNGRMQPLDDEKDLTEEKRRKYALVLAEIRGYLDDSDPDLRRWNDRLAAVGKRVELLREQITAVVGPAPESIAKPKADQVADKLASYRALVGDEDAFAKDWLGAIATAERTTKGCRERLGGFTEQAADGILPAGVQPSFERDLDQLAKLVYDGDAEVLKWRELLRASRKTVAEWQGELKVLEPSNADPVTAAVQADLAVKLKRLTEKGGIESERADLYRAHLAAEAKRIAELRAGLGAFDRAESVTDAMKDGLRRLAIDVGSDDADVHRWDAKRERIEMLAQRIGAIDRQDAIPDDLQRLFEEYEREVGPKDARLLAWQGKVKRINEARQALSVLNGRATYDAKAIDAALDQLKDLAGRNDRSYVRWKAKAEEVRALKAALAALPGILAQGPEAQAASHARLRRLASDLVGADDPDLQAGAARQAELDGPPSRPVWAAVGGRDSYGMWVDADLPGGRVRFRLVASGSVLMGSPDGEAGRDADELPVRLILPKGFWIADSELPRSVWAATMGGDPSLAQGGDPLRQPVDRVSWEECQRFCQLLGKRIAGMGVRLPLEAEWEYACRAGTAAPWFLPSDAKADADGVGKVAWTSDNSGGQAHESRARVPNRIGLYDMHGNLAEWCADGYAPYPTATVAVTTPGAGDGRRILRGASWGDPWLKTRAANRIPARADLRSAYAGLRLVVDVDWGSAGGPDVAAVLARAAAGTGGKPLEVGIGGWRLKLKLERDEVKK